MPLPIEDYALIGDTHTAALVGRDGSIDWMCLPRFDSPSTFAALLGTQEHGCWRLAPTGSPSSTGRHYLEDTFVLVTRWATATGEVEVIDLMPHGDRRADVVRRVRGIRGIVDMEQELRIRFDYANALPWVRQFEVPEAEHAAGGSEIRLGTLVATAGPDALVIRGPRLQASDHVHRSVFRVAAGETVDISLTWYPSHRPPPPPVDVDRQLAETVDWWREWARHSEEPGAYDRQVRRSLLVLRALTHEDTGGIVAAATTSLPEERGGSRNWDYRYVWLRDAALTLQALIAHGYVAEAEEWRTWLLRAIAGDPADVQIMYGLAGERRLTETELPGLPGYDGAAPVRIGNGAALQYQGDVFGEVMMALELARDAGVEEDRFSWSLQVALLDFILTHLDRPDHGIWEIRGEQRYFTHSRVMLWAALDRGVRAVEKHGLPGPADRWAAARDALRREIDERGFDRDRGSFRQHYDTDEVDASLLHLPATGYLAADDPRMLGTVAAIEQDLLRDGLVLRYRTETGIDGLAGDENPFLACSFWLVGQYAESGRLPDAVALMDRLIGFVNDVGLLSEEVDPATGAHLGNTPQALSHLTLVQAARAIAQAGRRDPAAAD